jgi:hypothetical protein
MIDATHLLGALTGAVGIIGIKDTPVQVMIHATASRLETPVTTCGPDGIWTRDA